MNIINISPSITSGQCTLKCKCSIDTDKLIEWNGNKYTVDETVVIIPAIHSYSEKPVDAEVKLSCSTSVSYVNPLTIFIPVLSNSGGIPINSGQSVDIPLKPFYYYTDKNEDNIVFGKENALLSSNIKPTTVDASKFSFVKVNLFYNPNGITSPNNPNPDDLYIDCNSVGEEIILPPKNQSVVKNSGNPQNLEWIYPFIPFFLIIFFGVLGYIIHRHTS